MATNTPTTTTTNKPLAMCDAITTDKSTTHTIKDRPTPQSTRQDYHFEAEELNPNSSGSPILQHYKIKHQTTKNQATNTNTKITGGQAITIKIFFWGNLFFPSFCLGF